METKLEAIIFADLLEGDQICLGGYYYNVKQLEQTTDSIKFLAVPVDPENSAPANIKGVRVEDYPNTGTYRVTEAKFGPLATLIVWLVSILGTFTLAVLLLVQIFNPSLLWG